MLRFGLTEPYVWLATTLNGPERTAENRELELHTDGSRRAPYANLILDMLNGDPMLFIRGDEAEEAWRIEQCLKPVDRPGKGCTFPVI